MILALLVAVAQPAPEAAATLKFIESLYDPATGGYRVEPGTPPSLRACNGASRATRYLGGKLADKAKTAEFVLKCYDNASGGFAEPGEKPDPTMTAIGIMAAVELGIDKSKIDKAPGYLGRTTAGFEGGRLAVAAVENYGRDGFQDYLGNWLRVGEKNLLLAVKKPPFEGARDVGGAAAMFLRLGEKLPPDVDVLNSIRNGQRDDGGWGKPTEKTSDLDSTYRVLRAFYLLKEKPKNVESVRKLVASCRNPDGGYGVTPGAKSTLSGVYYASIISDWLK
jgi:hypothetical protein